MGLCVYFKCSRNSYYKRMKDRKSIHLSECRVLSLIRAERKVHPRLGGKKLYYLLRDQLRSLAYPLGRDKFLSLLNQHRLLVSRKKNYTRTTHSYHRFHKYGNQLSLHRVTGANQAWAADITYIRTAKGFLYLSLLTDMYSRKIVGWELSASLSIEGTLASLEKALKGCKATDGLIHHSDRGIQYCSRQYTGLLDKHRIKISMTQDNHCYENAMAERVNGILKDEYLLDQTFKDYKAALLACKQAIGLYNNSRPHWSLNLKTPQQVHCSA